MQKQRLKSDYLNLRSMTDEYSFLALLHYCHPYLYRHKVHIPKSYEDYIRGVLQNAMKQQNLQHGYQMEGTVIVKLEAMTV
jgi:hypothetical protein